jgi:8-oxo-dGTP diphosphatase
MRERAIQKRLADPPEARVDPVEPDWDRWEPRVTATLLFITDTRAGEVLLIEKLTGFGAGKVNGPGGKLEIGETPREAAARETREEVGIDPLDPVKRGELRFQFADGLSIHCHVFTARDWAGEARASLEARPFWVPIREVPYDRMWQDDRHWLPFVLEAGQDVDARFGFQGDVMVWKDVRVFAGGGLQ